VIDFFVKNLFEEEALKDQSFLKLETVSPIYKECFKSLPKTLIIAAECDPLVDHSIKYHEKLQQFNVESELKIIKGTHHGFFNHPVLMKHSFNESQQHIGSFLNNF
jgi:acetyl esterase